MKNGSKCLITGGAGFIGSHLCDALIVQGHEIICIDNLSTGNKSNIGHLLSLSNFSFFNYDIIRPLSPQIRRAVENVNYIYHLASPASPCYYQKYSIETLLVNSIGTYQMLEIAKHERSFF